MDEDMKSLRERHAPLQAKFDAADAEYHQAERRRERVMADLRKYVDDCLMRPILPATYYRSRHDNERKDLGNKLEDQEKKFEDAYTELERVKESASSRLKRVEEYAWLSEACTCFLP